MSTKVAVVILNWNGKALLEQFLPSVIEHSAQAAIYIADNCSTDDSVTFIEANYPDIGLIKLTENYGFARGYNEALKNVEADIFVLLNSDVEVTPNWLNKPVKLLLENDNIAACQPKILDYNNKTYFEYAGAAGGFIDKYGYPFCRGRVFESLEEDKGQYDDETEIFWATGACMIVKAEAFKKAGELDPNYFAHMEEIDLCWRMKNLGYQIYYCGKSTVYHVGGGTLKKNSPRKTFLNFRNSLLTLYKNAPSQRRWQLIIVRLLLDGIAGIKFLLFDGVSNFVAIIKAHFSFYGMITNYTPANVTTYPSCVYMASIVKDRFISSKKYFSDLSKSKFS